MAPNCGSAAAAWEARSRARRRSGIEHHAPSLRLAAMRLFRVSVCTLCLPLLCLSGCRKSEDPVRVIEQAEASLPPAEQMPPEQIPTAETKAPVASTAPASAPAAEEDAYVAWFKKHQLDLKDPAMLEADPDGDGFTNRDEFLADSDPHDAASRPGIHNQMRLKQYTEVRLPVVLESVDGSTARIKRLDGEERVETVHRGETIKGLRWKVEKMEAKKDTDKHGDPIDVSNLTLTDVDTKERAMLMKDLPTRTEESFAELGSTDGQTKIRVKQGETLSLAERGGERVQGNRPARRPGHRAGTRHAEDVDDPQTVTADAELSRLAIQSGMRNVARPFPMTLPPLFRASLLTLFLAASARAETLAVQGSAMVAQVLTEAAPAIKEQLGVDFKMATEGGSSGGLMALGMDVANLAMTTRRMEAQDRAQFPSSTFDEALIGWQVLVLGVSRDVWESGVHALTKEQMISIYEGDTRNWKQVGGPDEPVKFYNPKRGRGVWELFVTWLYTSQAMAPLGDKFETVVSYKDARDSVEFNRGSTQRHAAEHG